MNQFEVRHVQNEYDLQNAYMVRRKVFVEEQKVPEELEIDEHEGISEHFVVYDSKQHPVGAGRLRPLSSTEGKVERISVCSDARGHGVGRIIMDKIEEIAKQKGMSTLILNAQDQAEAFYQKLGYKTVSDPFEEAGIMHVKMKKALT